MPSTSGQHPTHEQLCIGRTQQPALLQRGAHRTMRRQCKGRLKDRFVAVGSDLVRRATASDEQRDGINEDGFPGAGLAGQDVKP
jgi:hypothetical protein